MITAMSIVSGRATSSGWLAPPRLDERDEQAGEPLDHGEPAVGAGLAESWQLAHEAPVERRLLDDAVDVGVERAVDLFAPIERSG